MSEYTIEENDSGRRIDRLVRKFLVNAPLPLVYSSIRKGLIKLNGKKTKAEKKTSLGDVLYIDESLESLKKEERAHSFQKHNLNVILRTHHLLFINKEIGVVTHGKNSVDEKVKQYFTKDKSLSFSIGALHRLDKNTTGVLTFSQSLKGATSFSDALMNGEIERYYIGVNEGKIKEGIWKMQMNNKLEITHSLLLEYSKKENLSLSFYKLITGKKHQIRRASQYFASPLFCDGMYGSKHKDYPAYFLHSLCLQFIKPIFDDVPELVIASPPNEFSKLIKKHFPNTNKRLTEKPIEFVVSEWIKSIFNG
ncbi:MAG: pseudouridine synthase [Treponema sp.]